MKILGVIPARYKSSRFPGKPLADICGKPMIWWVYNQAKKVKKFSDVVVATDDARIEKTCKDLDINVIMTSDKHPSGTDRVAEVAEKIEADLYVVVMGDEPLINSSDINILIDTMLENKTADAAMLTTKFKKGVDVVNSTTIKLAINNDNDLIFMSRASIPYPKERINYDYYKNMGAYAFTKNALDYYKNTSVGFLESIEGIELLRLLENHKIVKAIYVESDSMSVDSKKDLDRVIKYIKDNRLEI